MDRITAKIRNYRSTVRYATQEEAEAAMKKKIAKYGRKYHVYSHYDVASGDLAYYYTVEREG